MFVLCVWNVWGVWREAAPVASVEKEECLFCESLNNEKAAVAVYLGLRCPHDGNVLINQMCTHTSTHTSDRSPHLLQWLVTLERWLFCGW